MKWYLNLSLNLRGKELMIDPSAELKPSKCWSVFLFFAHDVLNQNARTTHLPQRFMVNWSWGAI